MILFSVYLYVFLLPTRWHDCLAKRRLNSILLTVSLSNAQQQVLNVRRKTKVVIFGRDDNSSYFDFKVVLHSVLNGLNHEDSAIK